MKSRYQTTTTEAGGTILFDDIPFVDEYVLVPASFHISEIDEMNAISLKFAAIAKRYGNPEPAWGLGYSIAKDRIYLMNGGMHDPELVGLEFNRDNADIAAALRDMYLVMAQVCDSL